MRLGNNGASTETEIVNIAERIGSMGSIVGMSGSDILALASSIASTGQNAEAAGTAISKTMSFFETAVAAAGELKVGDIVKVMVLDVDEKRSRISLTIKGVPKE